MSLVRPGLVRRLAPLSRGLASSARSAATHPSDVPASTSNSSSDPRLAPRIRDLTPADLHKPIVFRTPVPRSPDFPTRFEDAPTHEHINYPHRMFERPAANEMPEIAGEATDATGAIAAITGLTRQEVRNLCTYKVVMKRVVNMTKKGKL